MAHGSRLMAHDSWLMAHDSWLMAHGSWPIKNLARGPGAWGTKGVLLDMKGQRFCNELGRRDYVTGARCIALRNSMSGTSDKTSRGLPVSESMTNRFM